MAASSIEMSKINKGAAINTVTYDAITISKNTTVKSGIIYMSPAKADTPCDTKTISFTGTKIEVDATSASTLTVCVIELTITKDTSY